MCGRHDPYPPYQEDPMVNIDLHPMMALAILDPLLAGKYEGYVTSDGVVRYRWSSAPLGERVARTRGAYEKAALMQRSISPDPLTVLPEPDEGVEDDGLPLVTYEAGPLPGGPVTYGEGRSAYLADARR